MQGRPGRLLDEVDFGFAGNTAPLGFVMTAVARGRYEGGLAVCLVYLRFPCVRVTIGDGARWRLFLVSSTDANALAAKLCTSLGL